MSLADKLNLALKASKADVKSLTAKLAAVAAQLAEALEALRGLHDWQNGPPLLQEQKQWQAAMDKAVRVLKKHGA